VLDEIASATKAMARELNVRGLMNVQFAVKGEDVYVLEVNPPSPRETVPCHKGRCREALRIHFQHVNVFTFDGKLNVHQPRTFNSRAIALVADAISSSTSVTKKRRDHAGAVTAVDAGFLDVLHDRADHGRFTVRMLSTSTSIASSRKRSTSTGRSGVTSIALAM